MANKLFEEKYERDNFTKKYQKYLNSDNPELILLKGHLIVEQLINKGLLLYLHDDKNLINLRLSFDKKVDLLFSLRDGGLIIEVKSRLKTLNKIRNKLAHDLDFEKHHKELEVWALKTCEKNIQILSDNKSYCDLLKKSISHLCGYLEGLNEIDQEIGLKYIKDLVDFKNKLKEIGETPQSILEKYSSKI